jgi:hypothetical protein
MAKINSRIILIDADVVSHFICAGELITLPSIFSNQIHILDKVYDELKRFRKRKTEVDNLLRFKLITKIPFPEKNQHIKKEYAHIKKIMLRGDGESACMAVCKFDNYILASSNLSDINNYCKTHSLDYLTTMDFLCEALKKGIFDIQRCNDFITRVLKEKGRLPEKKMENYKCRNLNFL